MFFLAPVHPLSAWTTVIMLTFLSASTDTQRTYRRQCDCEYMVDGRCAYTLLLPTSTAEGTASSPVCPTTSSSTSSPAVADQQIEFLQGNVSQLRTWVGNQANELIDVQQKVRDVGSTVGLLRDVVERLNASWLNQCPPGCNGSGSSSGSSSGSTSTDLRDFAAQLSAQRSRTDSLQVAFDRLNRTVEDLTAACSQGRCGSSAAGVGTSTTSNPVPLLNEVELERRIRMELTTKYWLCAARGLMISGNRRNVADASITASGQLDASSSAARVRINTTNGTGNSGSESSGGAWCAANSTTDTTNQSNWVQFDLGNTSIVFAVVTRGRAMSDAWVTSYRFEYSTSDVISGDANVTWTSYVDVIGNAEVFAGNTDADTVHINNLWQPVSARFVRLVPLGSHGAVCLRADVIGCVD